MISIRKKPTDRLLELGGGEAPLVHPECLGGRDVNMDIRQCFLPDGRQCTDIVWDFHRQYPLGIGDADFDGVVSKFCLEHVTWRKVPALLAECFRVTKPSGHLVLVIPNTEAQVKWILKGSRPAAGLPPREGMGLFEENSCTLFGDQTYDANSHASYFSPEIITDLLIKAGYTDVIVTPFGETQTDMVVEAKKPASATFKIHDIEVKPVSEEFKKAAEVEARTPLTAGPGLVQIDSRGARMTDAQLSEEARKWDSGELKPTDLGWESVQNSGKGGEVMPKADFVNEIPAGVRPEPSYDPAKTFDRAYFDGGKEGGGYQLYLDFPCHEVTARHVLARKPTSAIELGCGRGYVLKRLQDAGVKAGGFDVSKHCYLARVADGIYVHDACAPSWPFGPTPDAGEKWDLCYSVAVLEHIPESWLPVVIREMRRTCKRGLHGIFFTSNSEDNDKTKRTLRPREWWLNLFHEVAPDWPAEILAKDELEGGGFPRDVLEGDGKVKFNFGCAQTMFHRGWINVDVPGELAQWAANNGYRYVRADARSTLPFKTDEASLIYCAHMLEHLTYKEGQGFLRECRRMIRADGAMRIIVPDAELLNLLYTERSRQEQLPMSDYPNAPKLADFDEINVGCAESPTAAGKLWALLGHGHQAFYDEDTLKGALEAAGWIPSRTSFRNTAVPQVRQILTETLDVLPSLSLYVDATPKEM